VEPSVQAYVDAIDPARRPLFDRVHRLALDVHPTAEVVLSYKKPTYVVGRHRLYVGVWSHGLSFYGWTRERDAGFANRHPDLVTSKGTLKLPPADADRIDDDELRTFLAAALED